jgi:hypothetical protein
MRPEPRRSYLSALTFSRKARPQRSGSAPSRLSTRDAAKGAATFLAGAAGVAMSVKSSLDMNANASEKNKLTSMEVASRAFVDGAGIAAGMAALVDLQNTGATPMSRVVRAVGGVVAPVAAGQAATVTASITGVDPFGMLKSRRHYGYAEFGSSTARPYV